MFFIPLITLTTLEIESCSDLRTVYRNNNCCSNPYSSINLTRSEDIIDTLQLEFYSVNQVATLSELVQEVSDQDYWNSIELDIMNEENEENEENSRRRLSETSNDIVASVQIRTENENQFEKSRNLVICLVKQIKQNNTNPFSQCVNKTDVSFENVVSVHSSGHSHKYWKNWRRRFRCDSINNQTNVPNVQNNTQNEDNIQNESRYGCSRTERKTCCSWEPLYPWMWWWSRKSCKPIMKYRCVDYTVLFRNKTIDRCKFVNKY